MFYLNKKWHCTLSDGTHVYVENFFKLKSTGEIVRIGENVIFNESRFLFQDIIKDIKDNGAPSLNLIYKHKENTNIKVIMGFSMGFFLRAHIYENGILIGGDVKHQIYFPRFWDFMLATLIVTCFTFGSLEIGKLFYRANSITNKIEKMVNRNDKELLQKDINWIFKDKNRADLKKSKEIEWNNLCQLNKDYHCRLASYLETNKIKAVSLNHLSCGPKFIGSCFAAINSSASVYGSKEFTNAYTTLKTFCTSHNYQTEREKKVCAYFGDYVFKYNGGDKAEVQKLIAPLCKESIEYACELMKELDL